MLSIQVNRKQRTKAVLRGADIDLFPKAPKEENFSNIVRTHLLDAGVVRNKKNKKKTKKQESLVRSLCLVTQIVIVS